MEKVHTNLPWREFGDKFGDFLLEIDAKLKSKGCTIQHIRKFKSAFVAEYPNLRKKT